MNFSVTSLAEDFKIIERILPRRATSDISPMMDVQKV
jgi:hypothetical protein